MNKTPLYQTKHSIYKELFFFFKKVTSNVQVGDWDDAREYNDVYYVDWIARYKKDLEKYRKIKSIFINPDNPYFCTKFLFLELIKQTAFFSW